MMRKRLSLSAKNALTAQLFILPFYLGFIFFFLTPMIQSIRMSFSLVSVDSDTGYAMSSVGFSNYQTAFLEDSHFTTNLISSLTELLWRVPAILFLSIVFALLLNQKFKGRTLVRAIFFMPVLFASGIALQLISNDFIARSALAGAEISGGTITPSTALRDFMIQAGYGTTITDIASKVSNGMFSMVWRTGIQMILFLAGLQSISPSLYEASSIEGASAWENFWKITLPMLSPIIMVGLVYTIVDSFTDASNKIMMQITNLISQQVSKLGLASAFAWSYFLVIGIVLLAVLIVYARMNSDARIAKRGR